MASWKIIAQKIGLRLSSRKIPSIRSERSTKCMNQGSAKIKSTAIFGRIVMWRHYPLSAIPLTSLSIFAQLQTLRWNIFLTKALLAFWVIPNWFSRVCSQNGYLNSKLMLRWDSHFNFLAFPYCVSHWFGAFRQIPTTGIPTQTAVGDLRDLRVCVCVVCLRLSVCPLLPLCDGRGVSPGFRPPPPGMDQPPPPPPPSS